MKGAGIPSLIYPMTGTRETDRSRDRRLRTDRNTRKSEAKRGAVIDGAADRKFAAEPFHEVTAQKKAKTTARLARGSNRGSALVQFEQAGNPVWRHADARISNFDLNGISTPVRCD
jgi:hypothetical protein